MSDVFEAVASANPPEGIPVVPEPDNVRCARALGWTQATVPMFAGTDMADLRVWFNPNMQPQALPDFAADAAWVVRMIEANGLHCGKDIGRPDYTVWRYPDRLCDIYVDARGPDFPRAVVAWVIAAHAAGVEIRTEVER